MLAHKIRRLAVTASVRSDLPVSESHMVLHGWEARLTLHGAVRHAAALRNPPGAASIGFIEIP